MPFTVGESVGPYRITEQLGQGGMATVFKAYHAALDRYVALKVLHPAFMEDPNFLARFQREARVVAKLEHQNIVPIYDYAEYEGRPYLVMKFIEGETLKAKLLRGHITPEETEKIVDAVGKALTFAHKRGVLHRDVKPSNVLIDGEGEAFLADFGLARIAQAGESTLTSDTIIGTPQYISPEQAMGNKELDEGTDIYSFGVMLYELTVGQVPFSADTPFSIIHDHIYSPLPMPRKINKTVSAEIERVLLKALAKDRKDRFNDISAMTAAFKQAWKESEPPIPEKADTVQLQKAIEAATVAGAAAAGTAGVEADKKNTKDQDVPKGKRRLPWMWIAVGVLMLSCCVFTLFSSRGLSYIWRDDTAVRADATQDSGAKPAATANISQAVENAQTAVQQNPGDAQLRVELAVAYMENDQTEAAHEELTVAIDLGGVNERFFYTNGQQLAIEGRWLMAARMYLNVAQIQMDNSGELSPSFYDVFFEAVYHASKDANARKYLQLYKLEPLDPLIAAISDARFVFYNVDQVQGQQMVDMFDPSTKDSYIAQLLQAEFHAKTDQNEAAQQILNSLMDDPSVPDWIGVITQQLLRELR